MIVSLVLCLATGCLYGFSGGGLPPRIRTVALSTFDNQTPSPDLPKELFDQLHNGLRRRLGLRDAPSDRADAIVRGVITSYDADVPVGFSADQRQSVTARRRLQITIQIEIVDQSNGHVLYQNKGLRQEADYDERAEASGRTQAIQKIVDKVIEDVQSNW